MQQFLYRLEPTRIGMLTQGPTEHEARVVGEHFAYLQQLLASGILLMAGRTTNSDERTFGIAILVAESEAKARRAFPYRVALWSAKGNEDA